MVVQKLSKLLLIAYRRFEHIVQEKIFFIQSVSGHFFHEEILRCIGLQKTDHEKIEGFRLRQSRKATFQKYGIQALFRDGIVRCQVCILSKKQKKAQKGGTVDIQSTFDIFAQGMFSGAITLITFFCSAGGIDLVQLFFFGFLFSDFSIKMRF